MVGWREKGGGVPCGISPRQRRLEAAESYVLYFFFYSVLGWLYEVFLEVVVYRWGFTNRGVLLGPYCPVYGVGALVFLLCFSR